MTELILASILLPFAGGLLTLILPRNWIKLFSGADRVSGGCGWHICIGHLHAGWQNL